MAITDKQRKERQKYIGASDVAAILDLSRDPETPSFDPFQNAYDVWLEKTGKLDDEPEKNGPSIGIGNFLEPAIISWAETQLGPLRRGGKRIVKQLPILKSHLDASVIATGEPVEAKATNITFRAPEGDVWGDEGTDEVPPRVIIQGTVQCMATGTDACHNPVIMPGRGFAMFRIALDKDLVEMILERVGAFWKNHIQADIPPENCVPSLALLKRVHRIPETIAPLDDALAEQWLAAKESRLALEKVEKEAQAAMIAAIGTAEAGQLSDGRLITYYEQTRKAYSVPETKCRVARLKIIKKHLKG